MMPRRQPVGPVPHSVGSDSVESSLAPPTKLSLFVPHPESTLCTELARGSTIVAAVKSQGALRVYHEGNVIGAENLRRYRDRALQAASRMLHNYPAGYPTVAQGGRRSPRGDRDRHRRTGEREAGDHRSSRRPHVVDRSCRPRRSRGPSTRALRAGGYMMPNACSIARGPLLPSRPTPAHAKAARAGSPILP